MAAAPPQFQFRPRLSCGFGHTSIAAALVFLCFIVYNYTKHPMRKEDSHE
jgi:hypothetical protein